MSLDRSSVNLMGVEIASLSEAEVIDDVGVALEQRRGGWICPINLDVLRQVVHSSELQALVADADLAVADGMPLVWAARVQGMPLPGRVAGASLVVGISGELSRRGRSVYLVGGGNEGTAAAAGERLVDEFPDLRMIGWCCPPFGFEQSPSSNGAVVEQVVAATPDVVLVGLGFPKQDRLISDLRERLPGAWFISCGAAIDFLAGEVQRAPAAMQDSGLEWVHRLAQEPRRLARRYLLQGLPFAGRLMLASARQRLLRRLTGKGRLQERLSQTR